MSNLKSYLKEEVELEIFKKFLRNNSLNFDLKKVSSNKFEPADVRYDGVSYQITIGDKEEVQDRRRKTSKKQISVSFRNLQNVVQVLLGKTLNDKLIKSDLETILLVEVESTGNLNVADLQAEVEWWAQNNIGLCRCWKAVYLVYSDLNIKVFCNK